MRPVFSALRDSLSAVWNIGLTGLALLLCCGLPRTAMAEDEPAIGRLNTASYRTAEMCTATLIAPDRALTAAHCVTRPEDGYLKRITDMVFVAGWDGTDHSGASRIKAVHVHPLAYSEGTFDLRHDIAVIDLTEALAPAPLTIGTAALPGPLTLMGYRRSRPHRLTVTPLCYGTETSGLWRIGCRVEPGQSGGPVLSGTGAARRVIAVIVAVTRDEEALVVPIDDWLRQQFAPTR
ncbi:trypsin-like serine peptidase [Antarctobacter sp.]|uniref:trypsin-like serine peptidase n=1 Tax=Antarctobacter sp. TaxID=1872577 RepID=UPI002B266136|nr:trypsin-like peptidase domain-containing protein [Antarctobacter sp.]